MGYIYKITNKTNKKCYIGQTRQKDVTTRWREHRKKKNGCPLVKKAIKKYGIDNFSFSIVIICFDEDLDKFEIEYIKKFNSVVPNGYNISDGGHNMALNNKPVYQYSIDGKFIAEFKSRKEASEKTNMNVDTIRYCANKDSSTKLFIWRNYKVDRLFDDYKYIYQYDFNYKLINTFLKIMDASKETNISRSCIETSLKGISNGAGDFIFSYEKKTPINQKYIFSKKDKVYKAKGSGVRKTVEMYDTNKNLIQTFYSVMDIEKKTNIKKSNFCYYLRKNQNIEFFYRDYWWKEI
jgi:hypothetical protein